MTTILVHRLAATRARLTHLSRHLAHQAGRELVGAAALARQQAARYRARRARRIRFPRHRLTWGPLDLLDPGGRLPSLRGLDLPPAEADQHRWSGWSASRRRPARASGDDAGQRADRSAEPSAEPLAGSSAPDRALARAAEAARPASADHGPRGGRARPRPDLTDRSPRRPATRKGTRRAAPVVTPLGERLAKAIAEGPAGGGRWTGRALADHVGCSRSTAWAYLRDGQYRPDRAGRERDRTRER